MLNFVAKLSAVQGQIFYRLAISSEIVRNFSYKLLSDKSFQIATNYYKKNYFKHYFVTAM